MANDWEEVRLGDVADITTGFPFKSDSYVNDDSSPRLLRGDNLGQGTIRWDGVKRWPSQLLEGISGYWLSEADVVLAMDRPWIEAGLKFASVKPSDLPALLVQRVARMRGSNRLSTNFLKYIIGSRSFTEYVLAIQTGTAVPHISGNQIKNFPFRLPPIEVQDAVAHILGSLDDKIELNQKRTKTLEAMAGALFKSWFVDFDPVRAKAEGRDTGLPAHIAALFPGSFEDSEFGEIPQTWGLATMEDHFCVVKGLSYKGAGLSHNGLPMHNLNSIFEGGGYKYAGIKYYSGEYRDRHLIEPGDVIVANTEQGHEKKLIGYAAIVPQSMGRTGIFTHHIYRVRPRSGSVFTPRYLCCLLNTAEMHDKVGGYTNGTTVNSLSLDGLQKPIIICPPEKLVRSFDEFASRVVARSELAVSENEALTKTRDALLPKLISGELHVRTASEEAFAR